jgi:hypothetical protein
MFSSLYTWVKWISLNEFLSLLILSIHPMKEAICSFPLSFNHSIIIFESPITYITSIFNRIAKIRVTHAPSNFALVFVPQPQLKVYLMTVFALVFIKPPAPHLWSLKSTAPSNQLTIGDMRCGF